jgi:hypothetical protein
MRGLRSRLAVVALALPLGAAGARSLGTPVPGLQAVCAASPLALSPSGLALGWKVPVPEPGVWSGAGAVPCRPRSEPRRDGPSPTPPEPDDSSSDHPRTGGGLLGLSASPANAPPRS